MRPPEFTGGNRLRGYRNAIVMEGFNEAAGIHRRKRGCGRRAVGTNGRFNEAAGIHRRKQGSGASVYGVVGAASMRPPEFTGGNRGSEE